MDITLLEEILIIFGVSVAVLLVCWRINVPPLVGLIATGVMAGPHGLGWISPAADVDFLAEVGVALLLFNIGVEVSLKKFLEGYRLVLGGGALQVALSFPFGFGVSLFVGSSLWESVLLGVIFSLSSTALVLKLLQERMELGSSYGKLTLSILIFQDLLVMPLLLAIPLFAKGTPPLETLFTGLGWGIFLLFAVLIAGKLVVPRLLKLVAKTGSNDLFGLSVLFICFSVAWVTFSFGLTLALGAFLSGLIISSSEYHHKALGRILPLQSIFTCFFFVATGMFLDLTVFLDHALLIAFLVVGCLLVKTLTGAAVALFLKFPIDTAVKTGLALSQMGEFSFVLLKAASTYGLAGRLGGQVLFAVILISMGITPFLIRFGPKVAAWVTGWRLADIVHRRLGVQLAEASRLLEQADRSDHVVIMGFTMLGKNLAHCLRKLGIPFIAVDIDPATVHEARTRGIPILLGDASSNAVINVLALDKAKVLVVTMEDRYTSSVVIEKAARQNPELHIVARTRHLTEVELLLQAGAREVIPDEMESSAKVLRRVMRRYSPTPDEIEALIAEVHAADYRRLHRIVESR